MFELTLCLPVDMQKHICEFFKSIEKEIKKDLGIIVKQNMFGKSYLAIAVSDERKELLKSLVLDFVLKVIINEYKYSFFKNNITIMKPTKTTEAFLMAVSFFDLELDKEVISSLLEFKNEIVIDSFYYFKLQGLRDRWQRTAGIINQNGIMQSEKSIIEVLKYLCAVSDNNSVLVNLMFNKGKIELKNYSKAKKFTCDFNGISKLYAEIIKLNPMKINIKVDNDETVFNEITKTLSSMFEDKIYFN